MRLEEFRAKHPDHGSVPRFAKGYEKWLSRCREVNVDGEFASMACDDVFDELLNSYFLYVGFNNFGHHKIGLRMYMEFCEESGDGRDIEEKLKRIENKKRSSIWNTNTGKPKSESDKAAIAFPDNSFPADVTDEQTESAVDDTMDTRDYFFSPEHLVKTLRECYGEKPDALCAAIILMWMGVDPTAAVMLKKEDFREDCSAVRINDRWIEIPEVFAEYLYVYRTNEDCKRLGVNTVVIRAKNSPYFIERVIRWNTPKARKADTEPLPRNQLYFSMTVLNQCLSEIWGREVKFTTSSIRDSLICLEVYQMEKAGGGKIRHEDIIKDMMNFHYINSSLYIQTYRKWLESADKYGREYL